MLMRSEVGNLSHRPVLSRIREGNPSDRFIEVRPDRMRPTAPPPPCRSTFLAPHTPHMCMFLGFLCGQAGEFSPNIQVVALCGCVPADFFFFTKAPVFAQDKGSVRRQPPCLVPLVLRQPPVLKPVCTPCLQTAPCLETCLRRLSCISTCVLFAMPKVDNSAKGWIGSVGAKTGAAVVHATNMPAQYILTMKSMQVQCDGAMADGKMLPTFTAKRSPGCFTDVLHDILEGNPDLQLVVVAKLEHLFEYAQATVDGDRRQETVYLENLEDDACPDLRADALQGASRKNTSWEGPLLHRLCLSVEKYPSLSSPVYSLYDSPHQWSEHGPRTTSAGLWATHNNDPIAIPSLRLPLLIGVSDDRVKGADCTTPLEAHGEDSDGRWSYVLAPRINRRHPRATTRGQGSQQQVSLGIRRSEAHSSRSVS